MEKLTPIKINGYKKFAKNGQIQNYASCYGIINNKERNRGLP